MNFEEATKITEAFLASACRDRLLEEIGLGKHLVCAECCKQFDRSKFEVGIKYCSLNCVFWSGVDYHKAGCWIWGKRKKQYGMIKWHGKEFFAHRVGYGYHHNILEFGDLFNMCGNKHCVRGDHWTEDSAWKWVFSKRYGG